MYLKQTLLLNDSFIKINNQRINKNIFSFLNDQETQQNSIKFINKNKELHIILNTDSKQLNENICNKLNIICKKHQLNCTKIKLNKNVLFQQKRKKPTYFIICILLLNICLTFFINKNVHQAQQYQQIINKQTIKIKKTKNRIYIKKQNNQEILNQINLLNILISAPIKIHEITINSKEINIQAMSKKIQFLYNFYNKISKEEQISISIKSNQNSNIIG